MKQVIIALSILLPTTIWAQELKPGFEKSEYIETLKINQKVHVDTAKWGENTDVPDPEEFSLNYRSPKVAFDNIWDLWVHNEKPLAVIAVRGSVATSASFLANLYAAMVPATGELELDTNFLFSYKLANNSRAAVHVGWLVAMAYLSETVEAKIDSCYKAGIKEFILTGHSQGGGITYLLRAYLEHLKIDGKLPQDIRFKTYCSAGPKPGNLFFAYDYEDITRGGWAFNVVNALDWVPDVPVSIQTVNDFTEVNPFSNAKALTKKQKFPKNLALKRVYNKLSKPGIEGQKQYEKYLGKMVSKAVVKQLPNFTTPEYYPSNYYVRTGNTIVLTPQEDYFKAFPSPEGDKKVWQHHHPEQYLFLTKKLE